MNTILMGNNSWERLKQVIEMTGLSINAFAQSIGLKRAENLYQIKKGNHEVSRDLAHKITIKYTNINDIWLLTGTGEMYVNAAPGSETKIPFYDSGFEKLLSTTDRGQIEPLYYIDVPMLSNSDFATVCVGNSMAPDIPAGAIITLKEVNTDSILSGEIYFIVTEQYSTVKSVRFVEGDPSKYRLVPKNTAEYGETIIDKSAIRRLFLVIGVISAKVL